MKARIWQEHCAGNEWGNDVMERIAMERFESDPSIDVVNVIEHAGWSLSWTRDMLIVGTANDMAVFSQEQYAARARLGDAELVGYNRRPDLDGHKFDCYYPRLLQIAS
jgi:hypothetical protein